jgi:hypothetical protein
MSIMLLIPKKLAGFRIGYQFTEIMSRIKDEEGIPVTVQFEFAVHAWLDRRALRLGAGSCVSTRLRATRHASVQKALQSGVTRCGAGGPHTLQKDEAAAQRFFRVVEPESRDTRAGTQAHTRGFRRLAARRGALAKASVSTRAHDPCRQDQVDPSGCRRRQRTPRRLRTLPAAALRQTSRPR